MFSTSGGYHDASGDTMTTSKDVQYIGGYHEYIGDIMSTLGDIMSTLGDVQYIRGCSVHQGFQ